MRTAQQKCSRRARPHLDLIGIKHAECVRQWGRSALPEIPLHPSSATPEMRTAPAGAEAADPLRGTPPDRSPEG